MDLTTTQMALIFAACVIVIGGVFALWRRGVFGKTPVESAKPTGEAK